MATLYLDCNATTPIEAEVLDVMVYYLRDEYGNAGSRTHEYGVRAKQAVERAREQVALVVGAQRDEVIFTSGATESNNISILGLAEHAEKAGKKHIISTLIEHKAVLEPLAELEKRGFEVTYLKPSESGRISVDELKQAIRTDTLLVSVMHANNETGVIQPIDEIAAVLAEKDCYFHVDAAQTFGKLIDSLQNPRIDLISISAHKVYGPKGVGALITRRRNMARVPLKALQFGGGQERGIRPGTQPVHLIVGLGLAAELALKNHRQRSETNAETKQKIKQIFEELGGVQNGDDAYCLANVLNISLPGIDSEAAMVALKGVAAISNGSACTSISYTPSHVLVAMGFDRDRIDSALRISWSHQTTDLGVLEQIKSRIGTLK